jgi:hypothetical protein
MIVTKGTHQMKTMLKLLAIVIACSQPLFAKTETPKEKQEKPRIEVCFVLDTTGSMGGLIEGAKQKFGRSPMK